MPPHTDVVNPEEEKYSDLIVKLVADIRSGKLEESDKIALATVSLLEQIITESSNLTTYELSRTLRSVGSRLSRALPQCLELGNMTRRVLRALATEHRALHDTQTGVEGVSLQRLVLGAPRRGTLGAAASHLAEPMREHLAELRLELESGASSICTAFVSHIRADECVLTYGRSSLAARCLRAVKGCKIIAAGSGREFQAMAAKLSTGGVPVTVIDPSAVFAVMSRVNKVILSAKGVTCGGSALCDAGAGVVAAAARHFSVPVLVLSPLHLLTPIHGGEMARELLTGPSNACGEAGSATFAPLYDHIPPDHVTLYITNQGASSPTYVYRLLSELYDPNDHNLHE